LIAVRAFVPSHLLSEVPLPPFYLGAFHHSFHHSPNSRSVRKNYHTPRWKTSIQTQLSGLGTPSKGISSAMAGQNEKIINHIKNMIEISKNIKKLKQFIKH
jgi:hypothetical protein